MDISYKKFLKEYAKDYAPFIKRLIGTELPDSDPEVFYAMAAKASQEQIKKSFRKLAEDTENLDAGKYETAAKELAMMAFEQAYSTEKYKECMIFAYSFNLVEEELGDIFKDAAEKAYDQIQHKILQLETALEGSRHLTRTQFDLNNNLDILKEQARRIRETYLT